MKSLLYLGDYDALKEVFKQYTSLKGYHPIVCENREDLFYHVVLDRILREKSLEKITIKPLVKGFKQIVEKAGFSLSDTSKGDDGLSKRFTKYFEIMKEILTLSTRQGLV